MVVGVRNRLNDYLASTRREFPNIFDADDVVGGGRG